MVKNIVQIDINKIDSEIEELQREINLRVQMKLYAQRFAIPDTGSAVQSTPLTNETVSDFINKNLKDGKRSTKELITAYAKHKGKKYDEVANNISNALTRLKSADKIRNEKVEGSLGSVWFLK